jgi:hypothetical protein
MEVIDLNKQKTRAKHYVTIIHSILDIIRINTKEEGASFVFNEKWDAEHPLLIIDGDKTYYLASISTDRSGYKLYVKDAYYEDGERYELEHHAEIKYEDFENVTNAYSVVMVLKHYIY